MKHILLFLTAALLASAVSAKTYHHDFGTIAEDGGIVTHRFILDAAKTKYAITHAFPGCPCISADYPRQTIRPGQHLGVDVKYDPTNQNRHFTKSVYLYRSDNHKDTLTVTGTVKMTRPLVNTEKFPHVFGMGLRLRTEAINLGQLRPGQIKVITFDIYNSYEAGMKLNISPAGRDATMITIPAGAILAPKDERKFRIVVTIPSDAKPGVIEAELRATINGNEVLDPIPLRGVIVR